jgi:Cu-Zn family superoxide dismutase
LLPNSRYLTQGGEETPLEITLNLSGLSTNTDHGWHIHSNPVSSGSINDWTSFNPKNVSHGAPTNDETKRHYGDLGNFMTDASGNVALTVTDKLTSLFGPHPVSGLGLVIHQKEDDFGLGGHASSLSTENAGG